MRTDLERFFGVLRLRISATTFTRKYYQLQSFYRHVVANNQDHLTLKRADIERYLLSLHTANQSRQQHCTVIREFYEFIKAPENPAKGITFKPDKSRKLFTVPSQSGINAFFSKLSKAESGLALRNRLMAELIYGSGLRRSELAGLDIEDLDLENRIAQVTGKGNKTRNVPLTEKAATLTREYLSQRVAYRGPLIVTRCGRRFKSQSVYYMLRDYTGLRPHVLRHACATHMLQNGCGIRTIQELLGHKDLRSTQIYTHLNKADLREVIEMKHPRNNSS
jgi:site-specific recombinase XerD